MRSSSDTKSLVKSSPLRKRKRPYYIGSKNSLKGDTKMAMSSGGKQVIFDFRCEKCGACDTYAEYTLAPSKCSRNVREGNTQVQCNGLLRQIGQREVQKTQWS
jgi:hypothetical protein